MDKLLKHRGADADIAAVIYELEPTRYAYFGDQRWQWRRNGSGDWVEDDPGAPQLWSDLKLWFGQRLIERAHHWQTVACALDTASDAYYDASRNAMIFINISRKFQRPNYSRELLEELKIYYVVQK